MGKANSISSLRGMHDLLPADSARWQALVSGFADHAARYGFGQIATPVLERLDVFERLGAGTDVVTKEMYAFEDRDGSYVALRPESTAGVARSFVEHRPVEPWKVWYFSQHFRHERPQAGRYRQHHQLGAECFGSADPDVDVELMVMLWDFYRSLGLNGISLQINSIGDPESRSSYGTILSEFLNRHKAELTETDAAKIDTHPMRVLDSKSPQTQAAIVGAPTLLETMNDTSRAHFDRVQASLAAADVPAEINQNLVRGLDYYTHTVFEIVSESIDASQSTIGGGGRYDGLTEALGGPATPAVGFGSGVERILLACDAEGVFDRPARPLDAFIVAFGGFDDEARDLCLELRRAGFAVERSFDRRSGRSQMKQADRSRATAALILGEDEIAAGTVTYRNLQESEQRTLSRDELVSELRKHNS